MSDLSTPCNCGHWKNVHKGYSDECTTWECGCPEFVAHESDLLETLDALRAAATPGPWMERLDEFYSQILGGDPQYSVDVAHVGSKPADAAFIVAACNAIGPLIERVREAEADRQSAIAQTTAQRSARLREGERGEAAEARVAALEKDRSLDRQVIEHERAKVKVSESRLAALEAGIGALAEKWAETAQRYEGLIEGSSIADQHRATAMNLRIDARQLLALLTKGGE